jgi:hypothetical protein
MGTEPNRTSRRPWVAVALSVALVAAAVTVTVATRGGAAHHDAPARLSDPGMAHVHGLGVDPADGTLHAATHFGVFAVRQDGVRRVGNAQDTMGFAVVGPGHFLGSGHPDPAEDDEPLLGLIESTDGGRTWQPLSLRGEADFHALRVAHGAVYGYDATSATFMVTTDRRSWDRRSTLPLRDFAVDPDDPEVVLATTPKGPARSADGGRSWSVLDDAPPLVVLSWDREGLVGVDALGVAHASDDDGATWVARGGVGAPPEAMTVDARRVFVAVSDGRIVVSEDGARSFTTLHRAR